MEENIVKFEEKLKALVALGKKKKSVIECSNKYAFGVKTPQA